MPIQIPDAGTDSASHFSIHHPKAASVNLRNPLPLSAAQEAQVKEMYYKRVRSRCADEIKEFAACAKGRTVTATWACRTERFAMNSCMMLHASREEEDAAREEWFAGIQQRRRQKEEETAAVEKRRKEVIELTRQKAEAEERERLEKLEREKQLAERSKKKGWW
ncbi:hypothetical protein H2198_005186 [Neophaeococcomyces mojaviensis]|uniref:Uncharacterized protein n=1 Tax=Neophaeococcomyces mojaviensis TaxID=3383035 RepID=A0ACC3A6E7_9EURO|nr:hypothetical protein H2198_005186 [Knufia sp. JES_112]